MLRARCFGLLVLLVAVWGAAPHGAPAQGAAAPEGPPEASKAAAPDSSDDAAPSGHRSNNEVMPFSGWKVINLPTGRTLESGNWLFLISHRFRQPVNAGYSGFYGLDSGATVYLSLGYAVTDRLLVNLARSDRQDNVELETRYGLVDEQNADWPVGISAQGAVNWITRDVQDGGRWRSEALKYTA